MSMDLSSSLVPWHRRGVDSRLRVVARRLVVVVVVALQAALLVRGAHSDHKEFAFRMFPEASRWRAGVVRITVDGSRVPIEEDWFGYRWATLVRDRGLSSPGVRHHADAGIANQLAFLRAALDWVAGHTPRDHETVYLEATVAYWHNTRGPHLVVFRSQRRDEASP
jgi:hypothetical protein